MYRSLSKEEAEEFRIKKTTEINDWFFDLSFVEKQILFDQYKNIFKRIKCVHEFYESPYYGVSTKQCKNCDYNDTI